VYFSRWLNVSRDGEEVMSEGKHAPVTGKARRPTVESLTTGRDRLSVEEERSLCRVTPHSSDLGFHEKLYLRLLPRTINFYSKLFYLVTRYEPIRTDYRRYQETARR